MRQTPFPEICASLMIAALTGLVAFGGLLAAVYVSLNFPPSMRAWGVVPLAVGAIYFPNFFAWSRNSAEEIATRADASDVPGRPHAA